MHRSASLSFAVLAAVSLSFACSRTEETTRTSTATPTASPATTSSARVSDFAVGRTINPDKTIKDSTDTFLPSDTIYVSVKTDESAQGAKLQTKWYFNDKVVEESSETIAETGPSITEFHLSKPDGWPVGSYRIEVLVNGSSAGSKTFDVKPAA